MRPTTYNKITAGAMVTQVSLLYFQPPAFGFIALGIAAAFGIFTFRYVYKGIKERDAHVNQLGD